MAGSVGSSISRFFPETFGAGAPMSSTGSAATTSAATGAGSMALGPWLAASAGIQALAGLGGGLMGQQSAREAQEAANANMVRGWGFDTWLMDRDRANQMQALREGYNFMQSPIFQQKADQDFGKAFMLSGKFDPYLTAMAKQFS